MLPKSLVGENNIKFKKFVRPLLVNHCLHRLYSSYISPMHIKLFWATSLLYFSTSSPTPGHNDHNRQNYPLFLSITSAFFPCVGSHVPLRQSQTVSINPLEFPIDLLFMPWLFLLELLHLQVMERVRTITECFSAANRKMDRNYDLH